MSSSRVGGGKGLQVVVVLQDFFPLLLFLV